MYKLKNLFSNSVTRKIILFFSFLVILLCWLLVSQKKKMEHQMELKIQFIEQKNMLRDELDDIIEEHDDLLDEYSELNDQLHEKDSIIQRQISEIRDLIRVKSDLNLARDKIENLKKISKRYLANIDSLLVINKQLTNEKDSVINVNKDINWKNYKLSKENQELVEAVNKGSILGMKNVQVEAIKYKSSGREVSTKQARKTQKIRVCFTIEANAIAKSEQKTIYMQLIDNKGYVIHNNLDSIRYIIDEQEIDCTAFKRIEYKNLEIAECIEWERIDILEPGYYLINLIIEGRVSAQTTFKLK